MPTQYVVISTVGMARIPTGGRGYLNTLDLALWTNNFVPVYSSVLGSFTEASYSGYSRQPTTGWTAAAPNILPPNTDMADVQHTFTPSGTIAPVSIYGAFFIDPADGAWIFAQPTNVSPPASLSGPLTSYLFTPRLTAAPYAAYP
jgi:hypothetical protein